MADRNFSPLVGTIQKGVVALKGTFDIHTDASVLTTGTFKGGTWARTAAGEYTLTMTDYYVSLIAANFTLFAATAVDLVPQIKSASVTTTGKTIVVRLHAGGVATDPSATCSVHCNIMLSNSSAV